ncbi:MAG: conjugal transfer protein TraR [Halobacteriovoraceae bacterium]|nr:conjugal transfer protein TraR [Halobacteriovoraceae bacterium]MBC98839.1 conjugal transfer protein TraR [Halobacteriovoraceae bacterium]|tara:strand:- start:23210 stop:23581 length:372 start_codon:yes stop_codon:yes gene_type:complete
MKQEQLDELKAKLIKMKEEVLNGSYLTSKEDLHVTSDDLPDEADLATNVINQQVSFNMRHRELTKLRAIDEALHRIENGTYGECEECGDSIGFKRLNNQPFANLCIEHAEEAEREQMRFLKHG